jgi:hypothetical protein
MGDYEPNSLISCILRFEGFFRGDIVDLSFNELSYHNNYNLLSLDKTFITIRMIINNLWWMVYNKYLQDFKIHTH